MYFDHLDYNYYNKYTSAEHSYRRYSRHHHSPPVHAISPLFPSTVLFRRSRNRKKHHSFLKFFLLILAALAFVKLVELPQNE